MTKETVYFTENIQHIIEQVNPTKDLGVIFSDNAKFDGPIDNMCKKKNLGKGQDGSSGPFTPED